MKNELKKLLLQGKGELLSESQMKLIQGGYDNPCPLHECHCTVGGETWRNFYCFSHEMSWVIIERCGSGGSCINIDPRGI